MLLIAAKNSLKLSPKLTQTKFPWKASVPCEKKLAFASVKIKTAITQFISSENSILPYNRDADNAVLTSVENARSSECHLPSIAV